MRVYLAELPDCASAGLEIGQLSLLVDLLAGKIKPGAPGKQSHFQDRKCVMGRELLTKHDVNGGAMTHPDDGFDVRTWVFSI